MSESRKVGLYLSLKLWKRVRLEAMDREMSASKLVELAVDQWLAPRGPWQRGDREAMLKALHSVEVYLSSSPYATDAGGELRQVRAALAKAETH